MCSGLLNNYICNMFHQREGWRRLVCLNNNGLYYRFWRESDLLRNIRGHQQKNKHTIKAL